jgi:hypothetical protein
LFFRSACRKLSLGKSKQFEESREEKKREKERRREEKKVEEKKRGGRRSHLCDELECLEFMVKGLGTADERPWTDEEKNNRRIEIEMELEELDNDI